MDKKVLFEDIFFFRVLRLPTFPRIAESIFFRPVLRPRTYIELLASSCLNNLFFLLISFFGPFVPRQFLSAVLQTLAKFPPFRQVHPSSCFFLFPKMLCH